MSQLTIRQGLQTAIRALAGFASADVTLSDLSILDEPGALAAAPFAVILPATFTVGALPSRTTPAWDVPILIYTAFDASNTTWADAVEEHAANEEAVINALEATSPASGTQVTTIVGTQAILEDVIDDYTSFIFRPMIVTVETL